MPIIQDEFSYLFAGETFAAGRLANQVPQQWEYFEQIHVLMRPWYVSKYPPLQGMFLALGTLFNLPIAGVWLNAVFAAMAVYWMLTAVVPPSFAGLSAMVVMVQPLVLSWTQCYWGGLPGLLGGSLAVGGLLRIGSSGRGSRKHVAVSLFGFILLGICRPFEGVILGISLFVASIGVDCEVTRRLLEAFWRHRLIVILFALSFLFLSGWYNVWTTGAYTLAPYLLYELTYLPSPPFLWQSERLVTASSNHIIARFCYGWSLDIYRSESTWAGYWAMLGERLMLLRRELVRCFAALFPVMFAYWEGRVDRATRWIVLALCICSLSFTVTTWFNIHYIAPFLPLVIVLCGKGLAAMHARWRWSVGVILLASCVAAARWVIAPLPEAAAIMQKRASIECDLTRRGGKHLIVVQDSPTLNPNTDWVYNHPDHNRAVIVWVRDRGESTVPCSLFPDRTVWTVMPDINAVPQLVDCGGRSSTPSV